MSEKLTHYSNHFENKNFYITENDIGDLDLFFMLKEKSNNDQTHKVKIVREPIFYFSVSNNTQTVPIFSLGSKGTVGYSKGNPIYAGRIITNAFHNMPLINLLVESGISSGEPTDLPPLDFYITNKRRVSLEATESNVFQDCVIENLKIMDWNFEQGIDTPGRFFVFNFIATGFKGIHLKNYLAEKIYNTSGVDSLSPDLSNFSSSLKDAKEKERTEKTQDSLALQKKFNDQIESLDKKVYSDDKTPAIRKTLEDLKKDLKNSERAISAVDGLLNSFNESIVSIENKIKQRETNDTLLSGIKIINDVFSLPSTLNSELQKNIKFVVTEGTINNELKESTLDVVVAIPLLKDLKFNLFFVDAKDKSKQFSNKVTLETSKSVATNSVSTDKYINTTLALSKIPEANKAEWINFLGETNNSKPIVAMTINDDFEIVEEKNLALLKSLKTLPLFKSIVPKLIVQPSLVLPAEKQKSYEDKIKTSFSSTGHALQFSWPTGRLLGNNDINNKISIRIADGEFEKVQTAAATTNEAVENKVVAPATVLYKYDLNIEKDLLNGINNESKRTTDGFYRADELIKIKALKTFLNKITDESNKKYNIFFSFYTCANTKSESTKKAQLNVFYTKVKELVEEIKTSLGAKSVRVTFSYDGVSKTSISPTIKKREFYHAGSFPSLYNGNSEFDKNGKAFYPPIDKNTKEQTQKKYDFVLEDSGGAGTRLNRSVTLKINEVK